MQSRYEAANQGTQPSALSIQHLALGHRASSKKRPHPFGLASRQKA